jgi:predicted MFS family arabinose efflux permease
MVGGLLYGSVHWRTPLPTRFLLGATGMAATLVPLPFVTALGPLYPLALLAGFSIAPTMIAGFGLVERIVPTARLNEGMAWAISGIAVGLALGSAFSGWVVDQGDARWGFLVATLSGALAVLCGLVGLGRLRAGAVEVAT